MKGNDRMKRRMPLKVVTLAGLAIGLSNTWALSPLGGFLPGAARPESVTRALQSERPVSAQGPAPTVTAPVEKKAVENAEAKKIKFKLTKIILEGNHVYSDEQLKPLYAAQLGKTITVNDLFNVVQSISNYYRNNGYILSRGILPPQHVQNGVVNVRIIEGYIGKVNVVGKPRGTTCQVMVFGNQIKKCPPLQLSRLEKYLIIANEIPSTQVKAVLAPSKTQTGAADLNLVTENKAYNGYVSYDNYGTRYIGPQQITANIAFNSFIASGDQTQFTVTKTPKGGELNYNDINYNMPIDDNGTRLMIGGTKVHTHPLFVLQPLQIDGTNINYYTTMNFPLIRRRDEYFTTRISFNYLDTEVTALDSQLYTDHLRNLDLGVTYNFSDRWYGANLISGDFRQGLPILGYSSNYNPDTALVSRPGGRGDYTKIALVLSRMQTIKGPWSLYAVAQGQWAFNPVLASEQFTFGGSQLGRGYDIAELLGDKGASGSLELRYDLPVGRFLINKLQLYTFYDGGIVMNYKYVGGTPRKQSGTSTGLGVRFNMTKRVSGNFMWTQTLTKQVAAEELLNSGRRPRVWFSVVASFG